MPKKLDDMDVDLANLEWPREREWNPARELLRVAVSRQGLRFTALLLLSQSAWLIALAMTARVVWAGHPEGTNQCVDSPH